VQLRLPNLESKLGALEEEYRKHFLRDDLAQWTVILALLQIPLVAFAYSDYLLFGWSRAFCLLILARSAVLAYFIAVSLILWKTKNWVLFDRLAFSLSLLVIILILYVNSTRPATYTGHLIYDVTLIFVLYVVWPNTLLFRTLPAVLFSLGSIMPLVFLRTLPTPLILYAAIVAFLVANTIGIGVSIRINNYRRGQFKAQRELEHANAGLQTIQRVQTQFISRTGPGELFRNLLSDLLKLTNSEFGFIDEMLYTEEGQPYLKIQAIDNIASDVESREIYQKFANEKGLEFHNLRGLWGEVVLTGEPVISNDPASDPRRSGLPEGHPPLHSFLGLPFHSEGKIIGMAGIANRPGGYDKELVDFLQPCVTTCANIIEAYRNENRRKSAEEKLTRAYAKLEERVLDRTAGLKNANERLEAEIEQRKQIEGALRESESKYRALYEGSADGILLLDDSGTILDGNEASSQMYGYSLEEIRGTKMKDLIHPEDLKATSFKLQDILKGEIFRMDCRMRKKDGTYLTVEVRGRRVGENLVQGLYRDITDRKKAEEALRVSEEDYRALFQNSPVGIFRTTPEGMFTRANQAMARMLGYERVEELISSIQNTAEDLWANPEDRHALIQELAVQSKPEAIEVKLKRRNGEHFYADAIVRIENDGEGNTRYLEGILQDITDRKRSEELALQTARLRAVADLSSGVAHHFNNLLQIVIGNTSLSLADLESGDLSQVKTNLEQTLRAATLGAETVKRLQTFANVRADVTESESAVFDLANTARNAAEVSQPLWKSDPEKQGIKIDLQLDLKDGCLVKGQENEMFEVLVDLIRNAAEALPDGGDIEVKAYREADEVVITVRDTGIGIAENDLPKVFQPFWSNKGVGIGKGMGLAVSHGLVNRHGGSISVDSKEEVGTTFTIRLPLSQEPVRKTEEPAMQPAESHLTILVIDDDLNIATLLERICAKPGHTVFRALSGEEGLAIFNKEPVNLVLCDLGMPGMSGWDVGKTIRSICRDRGITKPPFILLTGWGGQELEKDKIAESGTDAVVAKPIASATVIATVQEIADRFNINSRQE
jgi:PAS domain S-box-containing protein